MLGPVDLLLVGLAALAAGAVNALAGGGTLITFPVLTFVGVPAVAASITNTVALSPGYFGATMAQLDAIKQQKQRLWWTVPAGAIGGIIGGVLLLQTQEKVFQSLVPFLILGASLLLAVQDPLRRWIIRRNGGDALPGVGERWVALPVGLAAIYGGYFGAGLSVIILAVLGLFLEGPLTELNALKQAVAFAVNVAAAVFFLFSGQVVWAAALVMAAGALAGGALGGKLAGRVKPAALRRIVVVIGVTVSIIYWLR